MNFWINDPKTGKKSVTVTLTFYTIIVACIKVLLSGLTIGNLTFSQFSGVDFAAMITASGGIYGWNKHQKYKGIKSE